MYSNLKSVMTLGLGTLAIMVTLMVPSTVAQFRMAEYGEPCINYENPFEPGKVCEYSKGLDCRGFTQFHGPRCSCYGGFVFDPVSKTCRVKVGNYCHKPQAPRTLDDQQWSDKCQDNAECGGNGRFRGVCTCKSGFYLRGDSCQ